MSKTAIWIVVVVVVVLGGAGIWWSMSQSGSSPVAVQQPTTQQPATQQPATPSTGSTGASAPTVSDNSDQSINQDLASVNSQMSGFTSDSASINNGLNDHPVQQSQF